MLALHCTVGFFYVFLVLLLTCYGEEDTLRPYNIRHGPRHSNRFVRDCQHIKYENVTHELFKTTTNTTRFTPDINILSKNIKFDHQTKFINGHVVFAYNPHRTVSVVEPGRHAGGCSSTSEGAVRATVQDTAQQSKCLVAVNAGFFNTVTKACLGNVVSNRRLAHDSNGIQNVHFGIKKDGSLFFGYLSEEDVISEHFEQLVGGAIWLLRNGSLYIEESIKAECSDTEETGTLRRFVNVESARTAVGHDSSGRLIIVQIDGKTGQMGVNLIEMAKYMKSLGAVNAINLDGGGSSTMVINGTVVNYVSDDCKDSSTFKCPRKVSTVLCIHEPQCSRTCNLHGNCIQGSCHCYDNWHGLNCDILQCGIANCSDHGICTQDGCECQPGYTDDQCDAICPKGQYGYQCRNLCQCHHGATCSHLDGSCLCPPGFTGQLCEKKCDYGYYGYGCKSVCYCQQSCSCHHISGSCNISTFDMQLTRAAKCLAEIQIKKRHLIADASDQYQKMVVSVAVISTIAAVSLIINISLLCKYCITKLVTNGNKNYKHSYKSPQDFLIYGSASDADDEEDELNDLGDPCDDLDDPCDDLESFARSRVYRGQGEGHESGNTHVASTSGHTEAVQVSLPDG